MVKYLMIDLVRTKGLNAFSILNRLGWFNHKKMECTELVPYFNMILVH